MTTIPITSAKLNVVFPQGKLPAIDPARPEFMLDLGGVKICAASIRKRLASWPSTPAALSYRAGSWSRAASSAWWMPDFPGSIPRPSKSAPRRPPMSDLFAEIRTARQTLRCEENRTHEAAIELRNCKDREKKAKKELDALLDELETGQSRYTLPGFDRPGVPPANGNGAHDDHQEPTDTARPKPKRRPKPCPASPEPQSPGTAG